MATVSGSATSSAAIYNSLVASNKGIGGLVSGLNTEELVEALVSGTRSKIAQQNQAKTLLQWKTTAYRGIATAMRAFQNKYTSLRQTSSPTYLGNSSFWNVNKASSSSDAIKVDATAGAAAGKVEIQAIKSTATSQMISTNRFEKKCLSEQFEIPAGGLDFVGKTMKVSYNGTSKTIKLDSLTGLSAVGGAGSAFEVELQDLVDSAFGGGLVKVDLANVGGTDYTIQLSDAKATALNGETATIIVSTNLDVGDDTIFTANTGNRVPTGTKIGDMEFGSNLIGEKFSFSINGVVFNFTKDTQMSEVTRQVTNSTAGVTMTWDAVNQCYTFKAKATGAGDNIVMEDVTGNFLNELIGARGGNTFTSDAKYTNASQTGANIINYITTQIGSPMTDDQLYAHLKNSKFTVTIDGVEYALSAEIDKSLIDVTSSTAATDIANAIVTSLNAQIADKFGDDVAADVSFSVNAAGVLSLKTTNTHHVKLESPTVSGSTVDALGWMGISAGENSMVTGYKLSVTGGGKVDYVDLYENQTTATYSMTVTIRAMNGGSYTQTISITNNSSGLHPSISDTSAWGTISSYANLLDAIDYVDPANGSPNPNEDATEYARLVALKKAYDEDLAENIRADLESQLNNELTTKFAGSAPGSAAKLSFTVAKDGTVSLTSSDTQIAVTVSDTGSPSLFSELGFDIDEDGNATLSSLTTLTSPTLGEMGITGSGSLSITYGTTPPTAISVNYNAGTTIQEIVSRINSQAGRDIASIENGQITLSGGTLGLSYSDTGNLMKDLFGESSYTMAGVNTGKVNTDDKLTNDGTNLVVRIDDQDLTFTTNTFTYKGITISVEDTFNWDPDAGAIDPVTMLPIGDFIDNTDKITINVTTDVDNVVDNIKQFIEDYNAMIDLLNSTVSEKKSDGYEPLTDEQKAEMSETEIANWETEAKKGLLRNDSTLNSVMGQLRNVMYQKADPNGIGIWDCGITTMSILSSGSADYSVSGKLEISDEDKLRDMLENNIDLVRDLFSNEETGLCTKLNTVLTDAVNESTGAQGSIVRMAGTDTITGDNSSYLSKRIEAIDELIARLKTRLENEYNRYWSKFTALETAISKMNTQMSYIDSLYNNG